MITSDHKPTKRDDWKERYYEEGIHHPPKLDGSISRNRPEMMVRKKGRGSLRYQLSNRGKSFKIWDGYGIKRRLRIKKVLLRQILGF